MKLKISLLVKKLGATFVAYDNDTSVLHEFNQEAFFILSQIKLGKTKNEIAKAIVEQYNVSLKKANKDIDTFLSQLENNDLIEGKK